MAVSTAQSIPPEIIREILKHFSTPLKIYMLSTSVFFPWYLGRICSLWRSVFISMYDEFWCKYKLYLDPISIPSRSRSIIAQTTVFLERTKERPFSFQIDGQNTKDELSAQIFKLLVAESSHWQEATFTITESNIPILYGVRNRVPCLRSLDLVLVPSTTSRPRLLGPPAAQFLPAGCEDFFERAPLLTRVKLSSLLTWRFNWHTVTSFHLTGHFDIANNEQLFRRLPYMTNLEELVLGFLPHALIQSVKGTLILLPRLRLLKVVQLNILAPFVTPSLEQLCLCFQEIWTVFGYEMCHSFFARVGGSLQYLAFWEDYQILQDILPHLVQLKILGLHIRLQDRICDYFRFLTCSMGEESVVPNLETLRIYCEFFAEYTTAISDIITSRTIERPSTVKHLQRIVFVVPERQYNTDVAHFNSLKQHCALCDVEFRAEFTQIYPVPCEGFLV